MYTQHKYHKDKHTIFSLVGSTSLKSVRINECDARAPSKNGELPNKNIFLCFWQSLSSGDSTSYRVIVTHCLSISIAITLQQQSTRCIHISIEYQHSSGVGHYLGDNIQLICDFCLCSIQFQ